MDLAGAWPVAAPIVAGVVVVAVVWLRRRGDARRRHRFRVTIVVERDAEGGDAE